LIEIEIIKDSLIKIIKINGKEKYKKIKEKNLKIGEHKL
jgi:hypothetical protein